MKEKFDPPIVSTCEELENYPNEYKEAIVKLVRSHAVNELYGARVFDELNQRSEIHLLLQAFKVNSGPTITFSAMA